MVAVPSAALGAAGLWCSPERWLDCGASARAQNWSPQPELHRAGFQEKCIAQNVLGASRG